MSRYNNWGGVDKNTQVLISICWEDGMFQVTGYLPASHILESDLRVF